MFSFCFVILQQIGVIAYSQCLILIETQMVHKQMIFYNLHKILYYDSPSSVLFIPLLIGKL